MKWQPMDTAPRDGTPILLLKDKIISIGYNETDDEIWSTQAAGEDALRAYPGFYEGECGNIFVEVPELWQPLPELPI